METARNVANYVSESVSSATSTASKEANQSMAKDSNQSLGNRASAATSALGDKMDEKSHDAKAEADKQAVKH